MLSWTRKRSNSRRRSRGWPRATALQGRVAGLVLAATACGFPPAARSAFRDRARVAESAGMAALVPTTLKRWFTADFHSRHPRKVAVIEKKLLAADPGVHAATWRAMSELDTCAALQRLELPTLVVAGELDQSTSRETLRGLADCIRHATYLELPRTGHMIAIENPRALASAINDFCESPYLKQTNY
jgi:3-oxoadipate enol-lactonase